MLNNREHRSICHASIGTENLHLAEAFYTPLLKCLDIDLICQYEHAIAYGKGYPEFWIQRPYDQQAVTVGNGTHFGFVATSKQQVELFYSLAMALGASCEGKPGPRTEYGKPYFGCFVRDLDGHKIEASFWDLDMAG